MGASFLPYSIQVSHTSAEFQDIVPWEWDLHRIDVSLFGSGRGGPLCSSELAACRNNRGVRDRNRDTKNNVLLHFSFQVCQA